MLRASILFFVLALVAAVFGANGIAGMSIEVGRILLFVFLAMAVISFLYTLFTGRRSGGSPFFGLLVMLTVLSVSATGWAARNHHAGHEHGYEEHEEEYEDEEATGSTSTGSASASSSEEESSSSSRLRDSIVEPRKIESKAELKPHFGLITGVANPRQGFGAAVNYGLDFGVQPFIPFSVGFELSRYSSDVELPNTTETLSRTKVLVRGAYNFGGDIPILQYSYLGAAAGPVFESRAGNGSTRLGVTPLVGFDVPFLDPKWSAGLAGNYLVVTGSDTPNSWGVNGVLKYWF